MLKTVQNLIAIFLENSCGGLHAYSFRKDGSSMLNCVENCRLGLRCFHAPVTLSLGLYMYSFCNAYLFSWCEVQMLFSKFTISIILGDPGVVSRVDKMFVVKVYRKIDLPVNFHHEHFIDPTNCPWVSALVG